MARLGHCTLKGTVVYKRPKHLFTVNEIPRLLFKVVNRYELLKDPDYRNKIAPWKTIFDISNDVYSKLVQRLKWEENQGREELRQAQIERMGGDPGYEMFLWYVGQAFNACMAALPALRTLKAIFSWVPYVGAVLDAGIAIIDFLLDYYDLEAYNQPSGNKGRKENKP